MVDVVLAPWVSRRLAGMTTHHRSSWTAAELAVLDVMVLQAVPPSRAGLRDFFAAYPRYRINKNIDSVTLRYRAVLKAGE